MSQATQVRRTFYLVMWEMRDGGHYCQLRDTPAIYGPERLDDGRIGNQVVAQKKVTIERGEGMLEGWTCVRCGKHECECYGSGGA